MVDAETTVEVRQNGAVDITVSGVNSGGVETSVFVGASVIKPSGQIVNIEPKQLGRIPAGETFTTTFSNVSKGCLSIASGGPESPTELLDEIGDYDVVTNVYADQNSNSTRCFNVELSNRLAEIRLNNAIEVTEGQEIIGQELLIGGAALAAGGLLLTSLE